MDEMIDFLREMKSLSERMSYCFAGKLANTYDGRLKAKYRSKVDFYQGEVKRYTHCLSVAESLKEIDRQSEVFKTRMQATRGILESEYLKANQEYLNRRQTFESTKKHLDGVLFDGDEPNYRREMRKLETEHLRRDFERDYGKYLN